MRRGVVLMLFLLAVPSLVAQAPKAVSAKVAEHVASPYDTLLDPTSRRIRPAPRCW